MQGSYMSVRGSSLGDHTELNTFTAEASLLQGNDYQPFIPFGDMTQPFQLGRRFRFTARGTLWCTGTPTYQWTIRLSATAGSATITGQIVGITAALTCQAGISAKQWWLSFDMQVSAAGTGANQVTLINSGEIYSPGGLASPFMYAIQPTTPESDTWTTANFDGGSTYWLNLSATCSASSGSNRIKCKSWEFISCA